MAASTVTIATEQELKSPLPNTAQARYAALEVGRQPYLDRARDAAALTIPSLLTPEGSDGSTRLQQPWQSVGSKGVNNLASKLLLVLFPPGGTSFRLSLIPSVLKKITGGAEAAGEDSRDVLGELEKGFGEIERGVGTRLEERGARMQLFEGAKHLIVTGNGLLQMLPDERLKLHKLDRFVIKRDQQGTTTEIVVKESVSIVTLSADIQAIIEAHPVSEKSRDQPDPDVDIYTWIRRVGKKWVVTQEIRGQNIPAASGTYPLDKSPWMPVRLISVDGEDYGRGFVEEVIGDLQSYDSLRQALVEGAAISSRMIPLVDEQGVTDIKKLNEARNGQAIPGRKRDVEFMQVEKAADLQVTLQAAMDIKRDLQQAFLLLAGSQRDAERVTAEEFRAIVQELESAFGGVYSVLAREFQLPIITRTLFQMTKRNELPALPEGAISLQIVTGIAGLGRNSDFSKLRSLMADTGSLFGPEKITEYVNVGAYFTRGATALSLDITGLVRSEESVVQARAEAQKMEMAKAAIGPVAKLAGDRQAQNPNAAAPAPAQ